MKYFRENSGQSLVELIMAIVIIEIGLFSVWSMFLVNYNSEREAQMRIVGANLAREGVELVKNIRDSNWLKVNANVMDGDNLWSWDRGLESGNYKFDVINIFDKTYGKIDGSKFVQLYLNDNGLYNTEESDKPTAYQRAITLKDICCVTSDNTSCSDTDYLISDTDCHPNQLKIGLNVVSEVDWIISGNRRSFTAELNLYNWQ